MHILEISRRMNNHYGLSAQMFTSAQTESDVVYILSRMTMMSKMNDDFEAYLAWTHYMISMFPDISKSLNFQSSVEIALHLDNCSYAISQKHRDNLKRFMSTYRPSDISHIFNEIIGMAQKVPTPHSALIRCSFNPDPTSLCLLCEMECYYRPSNIT